MVDKLGDNYSIMSVKGNDCHVIAVVSKGLNQCLDEKADGEFPSSLALDKRVLTQESKGVFAYI